MKWEDVEGNDHAESRNTSVSISDMPAHKPFPNTRAQRYPYPFLKETEQPKRRSVSVRQLHVSKALSCFAV